MAPPTKLAHVVYMTRRYDEMIAWPSQFGRVLGHSQYRPR